MKKYTIQPGENKLKASSMTTAALKANEVRIKVRAVSLNYRDILNLRYANEEVVPFSDGSGEVVEIGDEVKNLKVGDRVVGLFFPNWIDGSINQEIQQVARGGGTTDGILAHETVGHEDSFIIFPDHLNYEEAATLPCAALTAWHAMFEHAQPLQKSQTVLLQGTGGVSIFALQLAAAHGISTIVTSSSNEKLEQARSLGATHTINYRETPDWEQEVHSLTGGKGVDMVLEVGGAGTLEKSMTAVKVGGVISLIGVLSGLDAKVNPLPIMGKSLRVFGIYVGSKAMQTNLHKALSAHNIHPIIDTTFTFESAASAYDYQASGKHMGKVVIKVT